MAIWEGEMTLKLKRCMRSLERSDFNRYDKVADRKLHASEMDQDAFRCFVVQLIHTRDRAVLKHYTDSIQNDLWEKIQKVLPLIARRKGLPKEVKENVRTLMRHDFSKSSIRGQVTTGYTFGHVSTNNAVPSATMRELIYLHQLTGEGKLLINLPFGGWRWKALLTLGGSYNSGLIRQTYNMNGDTALLRERRNYPGINAAVDTSLVRRDSRFKLGLGGNIENFWSPLPDRTTRSFGVNGLLAARRILGSGLSVLASANWSEKRYADPLDSTYNSKRESAISANSELSYLFKRAGIVANYMFSDKSQDTSFYRAREISHVPSLLAHINMKRGFIRIGGGGGIWESSLRMLGDNTTTNSKNAEVHGQFQMRLQPTRWMQIETELAGAANYSRGDFNGWFPSWLASLSLMFGTKTFYTKINGRYNGFHRDIDYRQTRHVGSANVLLAYLPLIFV